MAEKKPLCLYGGVPKELAAGDSLPASSSLLVAEIVVSGSPVTSVTFSGLDGVAAGGYRLEFCGTAATASGGGVAQCISVNGNTTASNYVTQVTASSGTSNGNFTTTTTNGIWFGGIGDVTQFPVFDIMDINIINGYVQAIVVGGAYAGTQSHIAFGYLKVTQSNITSLTWSSTHTAAVGSVFRLYRKK